MGMRSRGARGRIISRGGVPDVVKALVFGAGAIGSLLGGLLSIENEVTIVAPGEIVHAGAGDTVVGPVKGVDRADAQHLADVLTAAGVPTTVTSDVRRELWAKAVVNAAINPLTAVLRVPNGVLVERDDLRVLVETLAAEGATAATDAGVPLEPSDLAAKAAEVAA